MAISHLISDTYSSKEAGGTTTFTPAFNAGAAPKGSKVILAISVLTTGSTAPAIISMVTAAGYTDYNWTLIRSDTIYNSTENGSACTYVYEGIEPVDSQDVHVEVTVDRTSYILASTCSFFSGAHPLLPDIDAGTYGTSTTVDWPSVTSYFPGFYLYWIYTEITDDAGDNASTYRPTTGTSLADAADNLSSPGNFNLHVNSGWDATIYSSPGTIDFTPTGTNTVAATWQTQVFAINDGATGLKDVFGGVLF